MAHMNLCPPARWGSKAQGLAFLARPRILGGQRKAQRAGFRLRKFAGEPKAFRPRPWAARGRSPLALKIGVFELVLFRERDCHRMAETTGSGSDERVKPGPR